MHRKVLDTIVRHKLLAEGDRVLVGVSGGPDSVALLSVLLRLRKQLQVELAVAHLNHGLRGAESDEDERFVRELAKRDSLRCRCRKADVPSRRRAKGGSLEEVARDVRYTFFRKAARELGANVIATGHTADDNAETLLMNLLRGAGLRGLAGIPITRAEGALRLVRPMLEVSRAEVVAFLGKNALAFRTDASNADVRLTRNRIRAELLPQLAEQYNPAVASLLTGTAEQLRDVADLIGAQVERAAERFVEPTDDGFAVPLRALRQMPRAVRTELLRGLVAEHFGRSLGTEQVRALERFLLDPERPRPSLGRGVTCDVVFDRMHVGRTRREPRHTPVEVTVPGVTVHPTLEVEAATGISQRPAEWTLPPRPAASLAELWQRVEGGEPLELTQDFDADRVLGDAPLVLRSRRPGDVMQPTGLDGVKKVQDIFVDEKLPAAIRAEVPLLCRGNEVVWMPGYRIAEACKVTDETQRLLVVRLKLRQGPRRRQPSGAQSDPRRDIDS
jgi:tRNA(Ile)-lysidine synthase